jgi:cation/acetate symporter
VITTPIAIFAAFVAITLCITYWSSRHARDLRGFYSAGSSIKPWQNGLAITGDYLSAASFLGTVAVFYSYGLDGLLYAVGAIAGWPVVTCLIAEPLRARGRFTFSDALCHHLSSTPVRTLTAASTLCICGTYLIAQLVGAGTLVELLFHTPYRVAVPIVGVLMLCYVLIGGMVATTWVQIIKAAMLLAAAALMSILLLMRTGFDLGALAGTGSGGRIVAPLLADGFSAVSLALAFAFGPAGMPHILMRFFTVSDARKARQSLVFTTVLIALFQLLVILLGFGASTLLRPTPPAGGPNMAVVQLAQDLGGNLLFGVVAAVTFATIVAVVAGLTLAAAAAISHDLYKHVITRGAASERSEVIVSRLAAFAIGAGAVSLAFLFQHQNVGFLATLPLVIAASANFPVLLLSIYWPGLTTVGAVCGGFTGLGLSVLLMTLSPKIWVAALGHAHAPFPFEYPTLLSMSAAFVIAGLVSIADRRIYRVSDSSGKGRVAL